MAEAGGFVRKSRDGAWEVDPNIKLHSLIANSIVLKELAAWFSQQPKRQLLLDVGCGQRPYAPLYSPAFRRCYGCDVPSSLHELSSVAFLATATELPIRNESLDCVLCTEVLEHVPDPPRALGEIARVLREGGYLVLTVPLLVELHEEPLDYYRFTRHGLEHLLQSAGFELDHLVTKGDAVAVILSFMLWPIFKGWWGIRAATGVRWLYSPRNPVLWIMGILPQRFYLLWYRFLRDHPHSPAARLYRRLDYLTLGYVVIARRRRTTA